MPSGQPDPSRAKHAESLAAASDAFLRAVGSALSAAKKGLAALAEEQQGKEGCMKRTEETLQKYPAQLSDLEDSLTAVSDSAEPLRRAERKLAALNSKLEAVLGAADSSPGSGR
mmetsp:Transcript_24455/g.61599  ORF Transcript_24455/g.61599 Transcript_24455/m.61599 type:complete len:114 (-) Transcript_24455:1239-1580(-)